MPRVFYTERDIEDMAKRGMLSLDVNDNCVLTELAYEKANRLGMKLIRATPDNPPGAPVRPYLSEKAAPPAAPTVSAAAPAIPAAHSDLTARIRSAALAKLGAEVDPALLESIIERVLKSTGLG